MQYFRKLKIQIINYNYYYNWQLIIIIWNMMTQYLYILHILSDDEISLWSKCFFFVVSVFFYIYYSIKISLRPYIVTLICLKPPFTARGIFFYPILYKYPYYDLLFLFFFKKQLIPPFLSPKWSYINLVLLLWRHMKLVQIAIMVNQC